jgi:4-amino-4-deoxy-L-arabinose transferase-like glycosyltransferase
MAVAGVTLTAVSLSWATAFDLTPKQSRPYAGSTNDNSMLELAIVHNGLERFSIERTKRPSASQALALPGFKLYDDVPAGPLRLANPMLAGQFAWLLPLALLGLLLARPRDRGRDPGFATLALFGLWLFAYGVVFSAAGGIFHLYYLSALTPPVAALAGIGVWQAWRRGPAYLATGHDARLDRDVARISAGGTGGGRRRVVARQAATGHNRRRGFAGAAGGLGAQRNFLAWRIASALGKSAPLARHR